MAKKLFGEFLVEKSYISREMLEEALNNQLVFGGRLGTNLIEMGFITEKKLAQALSEYHRVPTATLEDLKKIDKKILTIVDPSTVERTGIIPLREENRHIVALSMSPWDLKAVDEFEFKTGKRIKPIVITEVTFMLLKEKLYGIKRDSRFVIISPVEARKAYQEKLKERIQKHQPIETKEVDFYQKKEEPSQLDEMGGGDGIEVPEEFREKWEKEKIEATEKEELKTEEEVVPEQTEQKAEAPSEEKLEEGEEILLQEEVKEEGIDTGLVQAFLQSEGESLKIKAPEETKEELVLTEEIGVEYQPLTLEESELLLLSAESREEIAQGIISYALNFFRRVVLFAVKSELIMGWDAALKPEVRQRIRTTIFPSKGDSTFAFVLQTKSHYLGPLHNSPVDSLFVDILGGEKPRTSFLIPLIFRGKVVNILYGDGGPGEYSPSDIGGLLVFLQKVNKAYEEALKRKKKKYGGS